MKRKILVGVLFLISIFLLPNVVNAKSFDLSKYTYQNVEEVFESEGIDYDLEDYEEKEDQITIYLFRGSGCAYCAKFINYLNDTLIPKYGDYFKLMSFEVWNDKNNSNLMLDVADTLGEEATGVPYIVIGDKVFPGYAESFNQDIENAIMSLYNSNNRYDVFDLMENGGYSSSEEMANKTVGIVVLAITAVIIVAIIVSNKNNEFDYDDDDEDDVKKNNTSSKKKSQTKKDSNKSTSKKK